MRFAKDGFVLLAESQTATLRPVERLFGGAAVLHSMAPLDSSEAGTKEGIGNLIVLQGVEDVHRDGNGRLDHRNIGIGGDRKFGTVGAVETVHTREPAPVQTEHEWLPPHKLQKHVSETLDGPRRS